MDYYKLPEMWLAESTELHKRLIRRSFLRAKCEHNRMAESQTTLRAISDTWETECKETENKLFAALGERDYFEGLLKAERKYTAKCEKEIQELREALDKLQAHVKTTSTVTDTNSKIKPEK